MAIWFTDGKDYIAKNIYSMEVGNDKQPIKAYYWRTIKKSSINAPIYYYNGMSSIT